MGGECEAVKKMEKGKASIMDGMREEVYKARMKVKWLCLNQGLVCDLV